MSTTRAAAMAVALAAICGQALGAASCGTEPTGAADGGASGAEGGGAGGGGAADATLPGDDGGGLELLDGGSGDGSSACVPLTSCPPGVQCGRWVDPCTGAVLVCGQPCASGSVCARATSSGAPSQTCQPKACTGKCGVVAVDSCGVAVSCGGCPSGQDCVANQCVAQSAAPSDAGASDACAPLTCAPSAQTALCGTIHDGCGHSVACSCPSGQSCVAGVCSPPAPECDAGGMAKCGSVENACGSGTVSCGGCAGASKCVNGVCTACTPPSCGAITCGSVGNGCGPAVSCGTCLASEACDDGGCCTPMTCASAIDAGLVSGCAAVDLGCGVKKACQPCGSGEVCVGGACQACTPKACADFGDAGCGHSDGCGHTLDCCGAGTSCQGTLCCPPGEVSYNGSCCLPGCDLDQPPGTQISCGQVLYCSSGSSSGAGGGGPR